MTYGTSSIWKASSQSEVPVSVHTGNPQPPQQEHKGCVWHSHNVLPIQDDYSEEQFYNTERAEQGQALDRGDSSSKQKYTLEFPAYQPTFQQKQICYYWWSLWCKGLAAGHMLPLQCFWLYLFNYHYLGRSSVSHIKWTGIMEIFLCWVLWYRGACAVCHWWRELLDKMGCLVEHLGKLQHFL